MPQTASPATCSQPHAAPLLPPAEAAATAATAASPARPVSPKPAADAKAQAVTSSVYEASAPGATTATTPGAATATIATAATAAAAQPTPPTMATAAATPFPPGATFSPAPRLSAVAHTWARQWITKDWNPTIAAAFERQLADLYTRRVLATTACSAQATELTPYIVFDCDGTLHHTDLTYLVLLYLCKYNRLPITEARLHALLPEGVDGDAVLVGHSAKDHAAAQGADDVKTMPGVSGGMGFENKTITLAALRQDLIDAINAHAGTPEHNDLPIRLLATYAALYATPGFGDGPACAFLAGLFGGLTERDLAAATASAIREQTQQPFSMKRHRTVTEGRSGYAFANVRGGFGFYPAMHRLVQGYSAVGTDIHIVSASQATLVRTLVRLARLAVPLQNVHGFTLAPDPDDHAVKSTYCDNLDQDGCYPTGEGKATLIANKIQQRPGHDPILVVGNSGNDLPMLTGFEGTRLRVYIEHNYTPTGPQDIDNPAALLKQSVNPVSGEFTDYGAT